MADMNHWRNDPHWYWVVLLPILAMLVVEDSTITRSFMAVGLLSTGVLHGREWVRWNSRKTSSSEPALTPPPAAPRTP
ncbi:MULTISPECIES: hypothetical protein [unclassified Streptomyces]|uniref:hypothetical protein n=1 Tax=unclassified Streptomyces TaxID=2593676 RepID=UPI00131C312A|nr:MULTISPECIES: hypothetical protein [unclassified Streptomyces]